MQQFNEFATQNWELFIALVIILFLLGRTWTGGVRYLKRLRPFEVVQKMNHDDAVILDVRTEDEYKDGYIANSVHLPLGQLKSRVSDLNPYKEQPIIVCCRTGNRSSQAAVILKKQGFGDLYNLVGGIVAWRDANLPLTTQKDRPSKKRQST